MTLDGGNGERAEADLPVADNTLVAHRGAVLGLRREVCIVLLLAEQLCSQTFILGGLCALDGSVFRQGGIDGGSGLGLQCLLQIQPLALLVGSYQSGTLHQQWG